MARKTQLTILNIAEQIPDEAAAYRFMEAQRWPEGAVCPHCDSGDRVHFLNPENGKTRKTRHRQPVSAAGLVLRRLSQAVLEVLTGTMMHGSKVPVRVWVYVIFEMVSSKNGVSAREIERKYGLTAKTAWFVTMRVREAMKRGPLAETLRGTFVVDEAYVGGDMKNRHARNREPGLKGRGATHKTPVVSLIHKESGEVRSRVVPTINGRTLAKMIEEHVDPASVPSHRQVPGVRPSRPTVQRTPRGRPQRRRSACAATSRQTSPNFLLATQAVARRHAPPRQPRAP